MSEKANQGLRNRRNDIVTKDPRNRVTRTTVSAERTVVGVDGKWYDVADFVKYHPGGTVLEEFYGKDATLQFEAFHDPSIIKRFTPVSEYKLEINDPLEKDFRALASRMRREGWYDVPYAWYAGKILFNAALIGITIACCTVLGEMDARELYHGNHLNFEYIVQCFWRIVLPGVTLGLFWQQSGFLAHDFMHNSVFQDRKRDQAHGWFWGNVGLGLSSRWWKDEHFEHHFFTNTVIPGVGCSDPQQYEQGVFMQDSMLREFLPHALCRFIVAAQKYTFLPIMFLVGRVAICIASYSMQHGLKEWIGVLLHWMWVLALLGRGSFAHGAAIWYIGSVVQGLLALQLCLSHYDKPFEDKEDVKGMWARRQATVIKDISCPWWLDWIHGGLNYHIVHHLLPKLPRARFRQANKLILELLARHGIKPDIEPFMAATSSILTHLERCVKHL